MKKLMMVVPIILLGTSMSYAQYTANANLTVSVGAEASIVVVSSPAFSTSSTFADYTSTTSLTYKVRTIAGGTVTVYISSDFSTGGTGGGPSVAAPPTSGDTLTYTCTAGGPVTGTATACSTAQTATAAAGTATKVVDFAANTQSAKVGNAITTSWDLTNDPSYKAGSYTAVATYTISAS
jgi:hypothetical protein